MDDKVFHALLFKQLCFFLHRVEELEVGVLLEHHARVREEGEYHALAGRFPAAGYEFIENTFMAFVHTVKGAQSDNGLSIRAKLLYGIENFQTAVVCSANLVKIPLPVEWHKVIISR